MAEKTEKEKTKVYDFTSLEVEEKFDKFVERDLSKPIGNAIHRGTDDLGIDELARKIYRDGKVEMNEEDAELIFAILMASDLLAYVKVTIKKLFTI